MIIILELVLVILVIMVIILSIVVMVAVAVVPSNGCSNCNNKRSATIRSNNSKKLLKASVTSRRWSFKDITVGSGQFLSGNWGDDACRACRLPLVVAPRKAQAQGLGLRSPRSKSRPGPHHHLGGHRSLELA